MKMRRIQVTWDIVKKSNIHITEIPEGTEKKWD